MTRWIGTAALAAGLTLAIAAHDAIAAPANNGPGKKVEASMTRGAGARHHRHRVQFADRPACPEYIDRPCYYAPAPFFPLPPIYGYGWEWW